MEKPSLSHQARTSSSIVSVLKMISDEKALVIFSDIVVSGNENDRSISIKQINLSSKKYHDRLSSFLKAGLIRRHNGKYIPTSLGRIIYDSLMIIEEALSHYWKLKVIDKIEMSYSDLPSQEEMTRLIDTLFDNHRISSILISKV